MLGWLVIILGILGLVGAISHSSALRADKRTFRAPGEMISVGDRRLHLLITGEETGYPTVT